MKPQAGGAIERRAWLKGVATGVAGAVAGNQPVIDAATTEDVVAEQPAAAPSRFLDDHQRRTLTSLAELLVPGSVAAGVVDIIDTVADVDGQARQRQLVNAIGRFDQDAREGGHARWIDAPPAAQIEMLRRTSDAPAGARTHFTFLRSIVMNAYLATEPGMREFGWTGTNAWRELPGCTNDPA